MALVPQSRVMLSMPDAMPHAISPVRIELAMLVMLCSDEAHWRFVVLRGVSGYVRHCSAAGHSLVGRVDGHAGVQRRETAALGAAELGKHSAGADVLDDVDVDAALLEALARALQHKGEQLLGVLRQGCEREFRACLRGRICGEYRLAAQIASTASAAHTSCRRMPAVHPLRHSQHA